MSGFILSTHPVWDTLHMLGLPPEIINIIFSYRTFFSPIGFTFKEFEWSTNESELAKTKTDIYAYVSSLFACSFFVSYNSYSGKIMNDFIKNNYMYYYRSEKELIQMFICYYNQCVDNAINYDHKIRIKCNSDITRSTISSELLESSLKNILSIKFNNKIYNILKYPKQTQVPFCERTVFILNISYLWRTVMNIITASSHKCFSRGDLQLYNFMMGLPYKKSWTRQRLIRNLKTKEPNDNREVYRIFETNPSKYNLNSLSNIMERTNISTINTSDQKGIDYEKTLEIYYSNE